MAWTNPVADTTGTQALVPPLRAITVDLAGNAYTLVNGAVPVAQQQTSNVNGTLQNVAGANGNGTILALLGSASIIYTVTQTGFTGTVNFEVTEDNVNWSPLQVQQEGTNNIVTSVTGSVTTAVILYEGSVAGLASTRARVSNWSAGTVTVTAHAIPTTDAPRVMNANIVTLPAIVQKTNAVSTGSVTTLVKAFASNNIAGNSIVVVAASGSNVAMTIADSGGNTYTSAVTGVQSTTVGLAIFYATNIAGGANTVTLTLTSSSAAMEIYEVSGLMQQVQGALGETSSGSSASATAATTSNIAGDGNCYAFMGVGIGTAAQTITVTAGSNWTADAGTNGIVPVTPSGLFQFQSLSQFLPNLKPVLPTATVGVAENYAAVAAVFKPVAMPVQGVVAVRGYNYTHLAGTGTTLIKTGPGIIHAVVVNTPVAGTYELDDALTNTTPVIAIATVGTVTSMPPFTVTYDVEFTTGLTVKITTGAMDLTIVWR